MLKWFGKRANKDKVVLWMAPKQVKRVLLHQEQQIFHQQFFSPDCSPLDFTIWDKLAAAVGKDAPKNRQDLIQRIEGTWHNILDQDYVVRACNSAKERLRRVVDANGSYLKPVDLDQAAVGWEPE